MTILQALEQARLKLTDSLNQIDELLRHDQTNPTLLRLHADHISARDRIMWVIDKVTPMLPSNPSQHINHPV